ncbi:MAG: 3-hydroxyacyl-CoA dehydrogenase NAD-binding domain-containing protein [Smithellaceae bacterium]|nr:3-hydroxyacyl-CoA dehydrogenase NAD-binding domain-containing protein [Smithellaceae bacterium]
MAIKTIMVVGSGFMGAGIAQVGAQAGYEIIMNDVKMEIIDKGYNSIVKNLEGQVKKEKITAGEMEAALARVRKDTDIDAAKAADFIIEAAFENIEIKKEIFHRLDAVCPREVIFATNTSSISITTLAATVQRPDRFLGMHCFSPVPVMRLVEVIKGLKTSEEVTRIVEEIAAKMKKESIRVKDVPGFLVNRINAALRSEVYNCLIEGVASLEDIDKGLKLGLNHPMGPFELGDFVGLEIGLNVFKTLYEGYKDPKFRPPLVLEKLVQSGDLGRKTGKGWYDYTSGEKRPRTDINL